MLTRAVYVYVYVRVSCSLSAPPWLPPRTPPSFKAEIAFNGWALSEKYIKNAQVDIDQVVERLNMAHARGGGSDVEQRKDLEVFLAHYGTELVEKLGDEVDRLEELIHDHMPEVQYIDLEIV